MIGLGYVGLTTGLGFAKLGATVVGVEVSKQKLDQLKQGEIPFFENGLPEMLKEMMNSRYFLLSDNLTEALSGAEVIIIAVGTPPDSNGRADLSSVFAVAQNLSKELNHSCLLIIKSTVPVGTNRKVLQIVCDGLVARGKEEVAVKMGIASLPEFLREGSALADMMNPDRIVVGLSDASQLPIVEELHKGLKAPWHVLSLESAELTKYASNAFLATKISFINELANVSEAVGGDILEIAKAVGADKRIGPAFLEAGIGYGGSCFPKDVSALHALAGDSGYFFKLLSSVIEVNNEQKNRFFEKFKKEVGTLKGLTIAIWGISFKPDTDDTRDSIGKYLALACMEEGAKVNVFDPKAPKECLPSDVAWFHDPVEAAQGSHAVLLTTSWSIFKEVDFDDLKGKMKQARLFDGRNQLADLGLHKKGWSYFGVGRPF